MGNKRTSGASRRGGLLGQASWSPYLVGAGIGILSWIVFVVVDKPLGMSTAVSQISGALAIPVMGQEGVAANPYWARFKPQLDYGVLFLVGTFLGALVSALTSGSFRKEVVPAVWSERFGPSPAKRLVFAFIGGVLAIYGARLAGGCTSGHGISGSLQLALGSWTFFLTMFAVGVATAGLLFGFGAGSGRGRAS